MRMRPPHYNGIVYNNVLVPTGGEVDVLECDVDVLRAAGWQPVSAAPSPAADDDSTPTRRRARRARGEG